MCPQSSELHSLCDRLPPDFSVDALPENTSENTSFYTHSVSGPGGIYFMVGDNSAGVVSILPPPGFSFPEDIAIADISEIEFDGDNLMILSELDELLITSPVSPTVLFGLLPSDGPASPQIPVAPTSAGISLRPGIDSARYPLITLAPVKNGPPKAAGINLYGVEQWLSDSRVLVRYGEPYIWCRDRHLNIDDHLFGIIKRACTAHAQSSGAGDWIPSAKSVMDTITSVTKDSAYFVQQGPDDEYYAFFRNGMLDLRTCKMLPPSEDIFHTNVLDADYTEEPDHPLMQKWFDQILPDPEEQRLFFEYAGYTLYHKRNDARAFIVLTGIAKGGKSWAMNAVRRLFGTVDDGAVASMSIKDLGEKFKKWRLRDASMLIIDEIDMNQTKTGWLGSDDLKNWSSGGSVSAEKKGKDVFEFPCRTKFWFASNHSPVFGSDSGVWERYKVLSFDHPIPKEQGRVMYHTIDNDRSARTWLAMHALAAYKDLLARDLRWTEPVRAMETKREIMANGDTFNQWLTYLSDDGMFGEFPDDTPVPICLQYYLYDIPCQDAYVLYRDFVRDLYGERSPAMSVGNFAARLRTEYSMIPVQYRANGKRPRSYRVPDTPKPIPPGRVA